MEWILQQLLRKGVVVEIFYDANGRIVRLIVKPASESV